MDLREAILAGANLSRVYLNRADLSGAELGGTLERGPGVVWLGRPAALVGASLVGAKLAGARLAGTDLAGAIFELSPGFAPNAVDIKLARNLSQLTFDKSPHSLVELREGFRKAGLREQEREITSAIRRGQAEKGPSIERWFNYVLFDFTSEYGMSPGRTLKILGLVIVVCAFPYMVALRMATGQGGIWRIWHPDRVLKAPGQETPIRLTEKTLLKILWFGLYFSLLSAFHIGWRDLNVGNWIARIQPSEYTLRATGWVRTVSGIESLVSVYLLALWVLTYFGSPFG